MDELYLVSDNRIIGSTLVIHGQDSGDPVIADDCIFIEPVIELSMVLDQPLDLTWLNEDFSNLRVVARRVMAGFEIIDPFLLTWDKNTRELTILCQGLEDTERSRLLLDLLYVERYEFSRASSV